MKKQGLNIPARASAAYLLVGTISKALGIFSTPIFTRLLSSEEYGRAAFYISVVGMLSGIVLPFCSGSQIYGLISRSEIKKDSLVLAFSFSNLAVSLVICLLLFTFGRFFGLDLQFSFFIFLQILFDSLVLLYVSFKRYEYRYWAVATVMIFEAVCSPLLSIFFIYTLNIGYLGRVLGLLICSGVSAAFIIGFCIFRGRREFSFYMTELHIKESLPLLPNSFIGAFGGQADRLLSAYLLGQAAMGKYSVAHSLGVGLYFVVSSIMSALSPWITRRLNTSEANRIREVVSVIGGGIGAASVFVVMLSPEALAMLAPAEYYEALPAVAPIALSVTPLFFASVSSAIMIHEGLGKLLTYSRLFSLSMSIAFGFVLIPRLSYFGAGMCVFISELCLASANLFWLKRHSKPSLSIKDMLSSLILPLSLSLSLSLLKGLPSLRILLLIVPAVVVLNTAYNSKKYIFEKSK